LIFDFPETFPFIVVFFFHYLAAKQLYNDELKIIIIIIKWELVSCFPYTRRCQELGANPLGAKDRRKCFNQNMREKGDADATDVTFVLLKRKVQNRRRIAQYQTKMQHLS
jgi:hypothetical protein